MIRRFCGYAALRNLRPFDPFFVLFLQHGVGLSFTAIGAVLGLEKLLMTLLEVPLGALTDAVGRRRTLVLSFTLVAIACGAFLVAAHLDSLPWVYGAVVIYAVAEALRTGTHKGLILDWLTREGRRAEKTRVLSLTRFFSKQSAGLAALLAGLVVWGTGDFAALFWVALPPALGVVVLVGSYPKVLDRRQERGPAGGGRVRDVLLRPGLWALIAPSILFESQAKLATAWLQPMLAEAVSVFDLTVTGFGAVLIGLYAWGQGSFAGAAAFAAPRLPGWFGGEDRALRAAYLLVMAILALAAIGLAVDLPALGLVGLLGLGAVQNARRPLFVARLDDAMDPRWRTTTLSLESQLRSAAYAIMAPATGWCADRFGLWAAFAMMAAVMLPGALARPQRAGT